MATEIEQLRQEAEALKNQIRVRESSQCSYCELNCESQVDNFFF